MTDLKPCPFCGSARLAPTYSYGSNGHEERIECEKCQAAGPWAKTDEGAKMWNHRPDPTAPPETPDDFVSEYYLRLAEDNKPHHLLRELFAEALSRKPDA